LEDIRQVASITPFMASLVLAFGASFNAAVSAPVQTTVRILCLDPLAIV
jgi:hypothetical protein